jgi:hypothetical protein
MRKLYLLTAMMLCALWLAGASGLALAAPALQASGACDGGDGTGWR